MQGTGAAAVRTTKHFKIPMKNISGCRIYKNKELKIPLQNPTFPNSKTTAPKTKP